MDVNNPLDIATGVASHVIGGGDLFGGLIPVLG